MIRFFAARHSALAVLTTALLFAGCAKNPTPAAWQLSHDGEVMYNLLVQMEAAASGDMGAFAKAGERLLELEPEEGAFLEMAEFSLRRNRLEEARSTARKGLAVFPASLPLTLIISDSYLQQEKNQEASETLLYYLKGNPDNRDAMQELSRVYLVGERYAEFDALLKTVPAAQMTPYLHYVKARSLLNRNRIAEGEKELRIVVRDAPDMIDAWVNLGIALQLQEKHTAALPMFRKAVSQDPDNLGLWLRLVDAQLRAKQPNAALKTLSEAPASDAFKIEAAMIFIEMKQYATARKIFLQVRDTPGAPEEIHIYLAALAMDNLNNPSEALRELAAIPPHSPLAERALRWRLQILEDLGRMTEAVSIAKEFAEKNPENAAFQVIYAQIAAIAGDRETSIATLRAARAKWPQDTKVASFLASCLDSEKDRDESLKLMEYVLSVEPQNPIALNHVGYLLADANQDLDRAYDLISRAVAAAPEDPHIADSLAWVLYRLGKYPDAWEAIRKSIALGADHPGIWEHYGDIALKVGEMEEAKKGYANALKLKPENPEAVQTKLREIP
ncbi:MAG: Beta-barrel assembly-enhancing protease [Desulfovibrio sp.]